MPALLLYQSLCVADQADTGVFMSRIENRCACIDVNISGRHLQQGQFIEVFQCVVSYR